MQEVSDLEKYLRKNNMAHNTFAKMCGVSRVTLWKVKDGQAIQRKTAELIAELTGGEVIPKPRKKRLLKNEQPQKSI